MPTSEVAAFTSHMGAESASRRSQSASRPDNTSSEALLTGQHEAVELSFLPLPAGVGERRGML